MEKASHHFFLQGSPWKEYNGSVLGKMEAWKSKMFFLLRFPALLQSLNLDFVCYFIFFASTFQTIQFQYVFWVRKISMVFFSISCSRSCFFLTRQVFTTRMLVVRTRCGWIVTASLGHPFGAVKITRFPVKKTKRIASQIISKDLCLCLYGLMPFCTSASLQGGIEREVVQEHSPWLSKAIGSMGLVYLLTFTIKINHSWCG